VFGTGLIGYGPHRYREIVNATGGRLDEMLRTVVDASADDVISGYTMLYGGHNAKTRAHRLAARPEGGSTILGRRSSRSFCTSPRRAL
jgi:hypothetical protein